MVTDIILQTLNGRRTNHAGEIAALDALLSACTGSQPQYREFCARTLVPHSKLRQLTYDEGLRLYERALNALPLEDRTLLHHEGLWIKNSGHEPARARSVLTTALKAASYLYSRKGDPEEHIYTSLAANELDAMDAGDISIADGRTAIRQYLGRARSTTLFNPRAVHVEARLITQLLHRTKGRVTSGDHIRIANEPLKDVDQTLLLLHGRVQGSVGMALGEDIDFLEVQRRELLKEAVGDGDTSQIGDELWTAYRNQEGFILQARLQYGEAVLADKGTLFNAAYTYCQDKISLVRHSDSEPAPGLYEILLLIYYHWKVARQMRSHGIEREIDWRAIAHYSEAVLRAPTFEPLPYLYRYLRALGAAHLGDWAAAHAIWNDLRKSGIPRYLLFGHRDPLLATAGTPLFVQGVITKAGVRRFLKVDELGQDFLLDKDGHWPGTGQIAHAHMLSSFAGPMAVGV